jgi:hypothetical protein
MKSSTLISRRPLGARLALEAGLGHQEDADEPAQNREGAADDDPCPQRLGTDPDLQREAAHRAEIPELAAAQEERTEVLGPDLVCDPGLVGAARERVRQPPDRPEHDHDPGLRDERDRDPGGAHPEVADDQREPAAVGVRDDAGRDLEQEHRGLHRRAHQHQLQRRKVELADEVDGHHDPGGHAVEELEPVEHGGRRQSSHRGKGSGPRTRIETLRVT